MRSGRVQERLGSANDAALCLATVRLGAARLLAAAAALWWSVPFYGVVDLLVPLHGTPGFHDAYLVETGWGLLFTVLVAAPLLALAVTPRSVAPALQLVAISGAIAIAAMLARAPDQLAVAAGLLAVTAVHDGLVRGRRPGVERRLRRRVLRPPSTKLLTLAALLGGTAYALDLLRTAWSGTHLVDITMGLDHWPMQVALALAVPAVVLVAAARPADWQVSTFTAATAAGWLGATSVVYPTHAASLGQAGGTATLVWAILLIADAHRSRS